MAKRGRPAKKTITTKKATTPRKKTTVKKEEPIVNVEELDKVLDTMNGDPSVLTPIDEEILTAPTSEGNSWSDPKVYEAKVDPPMEDEIEAEKKRIEEAIGMEIMNGDPSVINPIEEIEEEALAETFKDNKINHKDAKAIGNIFGYSWNGMEMDW